jgi:hypothetical protein
LEEGVRFGGRGRENEGQGEISMRFRPPATFGTMTVENAERLLKISGDVAGLLPLHRVHGIFVK